MRGILNIPEVDASLDRILALAYEIRTYTEAAEADTSLISDRASAAEVVFFLGFGYHPQNLEWLKKVISDSAHPIAAGTTYGLGKLEAMGIGRNLGKVFRFSSILKIDGRCTDLNIQHFFSNEFDIE